jgi:Flp pilus assembly protein protease CpaA
MNANFLGGGSAPLFGVAATPRDMLEYFIYAVAIALVTAIVVLWIVGLRRPKKRSRRRHRTHRALRRRDSTFAETDGSPRVRGDQSSSTEHYQR